jgi:hypothetical protein
MNVSTRQEYLDLIKKRKKLFRIFFFSRYDCRFLYRNGRRSPGYTFIDERSEYDYGYMFAYSDQELLLTKKWKTIFLQMLNKDVWQKLLLYKENYPEKECILRWQNHEILIEGISKKIKTNGKAEFSKCCLCF